MQPRKVLDRIAAAPVRITPIYQDASRRLPFADNSFDTVVTTWTLCSIDDVESAVREIGRVLKPTGSYLFLEHGRSTSPKVVRQQELLAPIVRVVGAGCRMNRQIDRLISEAGLQIVVLNRFRMPNTPQILGEMYKRGRQGCEGIEGGEGELSWAACPSLDYSRPSDCIYLE